MTEAMLSFFGPGHGVRAALGAVPPGMNAEMLRSVSQALANAAERAEHSGAVAHSPFGGTVIDGGTTILVNGKVVQPSELAGSLVGLPAAITDIPVPEAADPSPGMPARVNLDSIQDTGVDIVGDRLYAFGLTVSLAGRQPYRMKHAAVVPAAQVARLVLGASFPAQVDPAHPDQITVHWER